MYCYLFRMSPPRMTTTSDLANECQAIRDDGSEVSMIPMLLAVFFILHKHFSGSPEHVWLEYKPLRARSVLPHCAQSDQPISDSHSGVVMKTASRT